MNRQAVKIDAGGGIVLPADIRAALGVKPGDTVWLEQDEHKKVRIATARQALTRIQNLVEHYAPGSRSLAEGLLAERREEAAHE